MLAKNHEFKLTIIFLIVTIVVVDIEAQSSCTTLRKLPGLCVPILTCESTTKLLNSAPRPLPPSIIQLVQQSHCGTFNGVHHVCCETNSVSGGGGGQVTTSTTIRTPVVQTSGGDSNSKIRPSVDKTDANVQTGMSILEATKCGTVSDDRVANGEDANLFEFPWMALLMYEGVETTLDCGGSLITDQYVLTAAHCIRVGNKRLIKVRLGEYDIRQPIDCMVKRKTKKCAPAVQDIDVEEAIYHKDYSPSRFSDDIGLIRLVSKVVTGDSVRPICLPITPYSRSTNLQRLIIAGWGRIESGLRASVLQKAVVPVKTNEYCQQIHRIIQITDGQLCAGGENEIDTCKGDSGGPIFISSRYRNGARFVQYGVVSAGSSQCGSNFPGIYVRVTSYLPWIAGNINP